MLRSLTSPPLFFRYANAVLVAIAFLGLSLVLQPYGDDNPFLFFVAAVALSAWYGGLGPGLVTTILAVTLVEYFLLEPRYTAFARNRDIFELVIFAFVAFLVSWTETHRRRTAEALHRAHDELQVILDGVSDGITAQDGTGNFVFANQAAAEFSGYSSAQAMVATPVKEVRHKLRMYDEKGDQIPLPAFPRNRVYAEKKPVSLSFRLVDMDTDIERWVLMTSAPIFNEQGKIVLVVNIFRDVTEQILIQHDRADLAAIVNNSEDAIIGKTLDRIITRWNPGAERLYGYSAEEAIGQSVTMLFPEEIMERELGLNARIQRGERIHHYETVRVRKDGQKVDISLTISPIRDPQGDLIGYSTIERDISQRRRLERMQEENMRFLRRVLNTLPLLVGVMSPDGILVEVNRAALDVASLSPEDVVGKPLDLTYWWAYSTEMQTELRLAISRAREGERVRFDATIRVAEDRYMTMDLMISPMFDAEDQVSYLIAAATDITERKKREEEVLRLTLITEAQRRRLNLIIGSVPGIVFDGTIDPESGMETDFISHYAENMLGYPLDSWQIQPNFWQEIIHEEDMGQLAQNAKAIYESGKPGTLQFRCLAQNGQVVDAEAHIVIVQDAERNRINASGVIMDITARRETEESLAQYTEELQRSNDELEQFAYIASHDLQEPLRMVASYLQLIKQRYGDQLDSDGTEFIDFAVDGAARMKTLINDLLAYSHLQRDRSEFETVSMDDILEQVLRSLHLAIEDSGAVVTHDPLPEIKAIEGQMSQLFQNLIGNAMKFRSETPPEVHIAARREGRKWIFSVSDNGIGIEPEFVDRIFLIFQRLHPRDEYPGTGIGLAICRKIVEDHNGRIWVESQPGKGTTFYFSMPIERSRRRRLHASR